MANPKPDSVARWIRDQLSAAVHESLRKGETPSAAKTADYVWGEIRRKAVLGDHVAAAAIATAGRSHLVAVANSVCRGADVAAWVTSGGGIVETTVSERYAVPSRTEDGLVDKTVYRQYPLLYQLTRSQLMQLKADFQSKGDKFLMNAAVVQRAIDLMDRYPSAQTVEGACQQAGIDWNDFLLDTDAV